MEVAQGIRRECGLDTLKLDDEVVRHLRQTLDDVSRSVLYPRDALLMAQLVHNADDKDYPHGVVPTLSIDLHGLEVRAECNEVGLTEETVRGLCGVSRGMNRESSGRTIQDEAGFRSLFTFTDVVRVLSGPYALRFDIRESLGMFAPTREYEHPPKPGWTTFCLELRTEQARREAIQQLHDTLPSLLLFLRRVRCVDIKIDDTTRRWEIVTESDHIGLRETQADGRILRSLSYNVFRRTIPIDKDERRRKGISGTDIAFAFPVTSTMEPHESFEKVYAHLPIGDYGFRFAIQADFLGHGDSVSGHEWNRVVREAIPPAAVEAFLTLQSRPTLTYTWMRYLDSRISSDFFQPVQQELIALLRTTPVLRSLHAQSCCPQDTLSIPPLFRDAQGNPLIAEEYVDPKVYISSRYDMARDGAILRTLGVTAMSSEAFVTALSNMQADGTLHEMSIEWWEAVCRALVRFLATDTPLAARVRTLRIIPLVDGRWVAANAGAIHFDSRFGDIPRDLDFMLVKAVPPRSARRALFIALGVTEANARVVAQRIHDVHQLYPEDLLPESVVSHAQYLFHHRLNVKFSCMLYVLTEDNLVMEAKDVYMDHSDYREPWLSDFLSSHAHFLAPEYDDMPDHWLEPYSTWRDWLRDEVGVAVAPRYGSDGLSPEFSAFLLSASTIDILELIKLYGESFVSVLLKCDAAAKELRSTLVTTSDGDMRPLHSTFLKRGALRHLEHLPFLPVPDPDNSAWDVLSLLGVTCAVDAKFYLQELVCLSGRPLREVWPGQIDSTLKVATSLYKQLDARFLDSDHGTDIRTAFKEQRLIYVPPESTSTPARGRWLSSVEMTWEAADPQDGTPLKEVYGALQSFFCERIGAGPSQDYALFRPLAEFVRAHGDEPLDPLAHRKIHALLAELSTSRAASSEAGKLFLAELPCLPVRGTDGEVKLMSVTDDIFFPDLTGEVAEFFRGRIPLVTTAPQDEDRSSLGRLLRLFLPVPITQERLLVNVLEKNPSREDEVALPDVSSSLHYQSRLRYIRRHARKQGDGRDVRAINKFVDKLEDIGIYEVDSDMVENVYTVGDVDCLRSQFVEIEIAEGRCHILVGQACQEKRDFYICEALTRLCHGGLSVSDLLVIFTQPTEVLELIYSDTSGGTEEEARRILTVELEFEGILADDVVSDSQSESSLESDSPGLYLGSMRLVNDDVDVDDGGDIPSVFCGMITVVPRGPGGRKLAASTPVPRWALKLIDAETHREFLHHNLTWYNGIMGELYVLAKLQKILANFTHLNWTSELRNFTKFDKFIGESVADFAYHDTKGDLTDVLFGSAKRKQWKGAWPIFYLEVKTTNASVDNAGNAACGLSPLQYSTASMMALREDPSKVPRHVYVLIRVTAIRRVPEADFYVDPWNLVYKGGRLQREDIKIGLLPRGQILWGKGRTSRSI